MQTRLIAAWLLGSALIGAGVLWADTKQEPTSFEFVVTSKAPRSRDVVFVMGQPTPACPLYPANIACARDVYFNGDWKGTRLCKGLQCVEFEEIFK